MKLFVTSVLLLATLSFGDNETDETIKCEKLGCNYDPHDDISKLITCKPDGIQLSVNFTGNNNCNDWRDFEGIVSKSSPNNTCCSKESSNESTPEPLIMGGTSVTHNKYPFIVEIYNTAQNMHWCGGSILKKQYPAMILTAAHCKDAFGSNGLVKIGANSINDPNAIKSSILHYEIHNNWNYPNQDDNDVAILWLAKDISSFNQFEAINTLWKPTGYECCPNNDDLQVIGYGWDYDGTTTATLEYVDIDYVDRQSCINKYQGVEIVTNTMLCATAGACHGDSGGPLIKKGTTQQVGIVSHGGPELPNSGSACDLGHPAVYTDLMSASVYNWIISKWNTEVPDSNRCKFPWYYAGLFNTGCTTVGSINGQPWCSEDTYYNAGVSKWYYCNA